MKRRMASARCCCDVVEVPVYFREFGRLQSDRTEASAGVFGPWQDGGVANLVIIGRHKVGTLGFPFVRHFRDNGYIVQPTNVAQGTTITSATLELTANVANAAYDPTSVLVNIYVRDADDTSASEITSSTYDPANTNGSRNAPDNPAVPYFGPITATITGNASIDITSIVQPVINRAGWVSGNRLGVLISVDDSDTEQDANVTNQLYWVSGNRASSDVTDPGTQLALRNRVVVVV